MPIKRCTLPSGGSGYKYGNSGKCYASKGDALKQMAAIKSQQSKGALDEFVRELIIMGYNDFEILDIILPKEKQ